MPTCSARYLDEKGNIKNIKRLFIQGACTVDCIHWENCLLELAGGYGNVMPLITEQEAYLREKHKVK